VDRTAGGPQSRQPSVGGTVGVVVVSVGTVEVLPVEVLPVVVVGESSLGSDAVCLGALSSLDSWVDLDVVLRSLESRLTLSVAGCSVSRVSEEPLSWTRDRSACCGRVGAAARAGCDVESSENVTGGLVAAARDT
jgi:hypothetical protein